MNIMDRISASRQENFEVVKGWVEEASGGFLTASYHGDGYFSNVSIHRADGAVLDGPDTGPRGAGPVGDTPITGVMFSIDLFGPNRITRRNRRVTREVYCAVRKTLYRYLSEQPDVAVEAMWRFREHNHIPLTV